MAKQLKSRRWWGVAYMHSDGTVTLMAKTIRETRKLSIDAMNPLLTWEQWKIRNFRAVRVTVTVDSKGEGK